MNAPAEDNLVDVACGIHCGRYPLAGMTVGEARRRMTPRMNVDPAAVSIVDGRLVDDEQQSVLAAGQLLVFVKRAGEMG